jgi:hypothetical protein
MNTEDSNSQRDLQRQLKLRATPSLEGLKYQDFSRSLKYTVNEVMIA